jgi:hypothetical protein
MRLVLGDGMLLTLIHICSVGRFGRRHTVIESFLFRVSSSDIVSFAVFPSSWRRFPAGGVCPGGNGDAARSNVRTSLRIEFTTGGLAFGGTDLHHVPARRRGAITL